MQYRLLGNSGLRVSEAALGTMTFGEDWGWGAAKDEARKIYDAFREAGGNFIDTANIYTNGASESFLGEFMEGHRQSVVLATKYTNSFPGTDPNAAGNQRKNMMQSVEASLRRLRTGYIDLYWVHIWDQITPVEEVMRGLDDLVRAGKVLYVGISDAPAWWIAQANTLAHLRGWSPLRRIADRIQPDRANRGAGTDPDGEVFEHRRDRLVAAREWRAHGQVSRLAGVFRTRTYEQRDDERVPAGAATDRPHRRGRQECGSRNRPQHGAGGAGLASIPFCAGDSDSGCKKTLAV